MGNALIFSVAILVIINHFNKNILKKIILPFIVFSYIFLSIWTLIQSPQPRVDSFIQQKEAPLKLIQGINPYNSVYTKVYSNVEPNYFGYLPFSFIYHLPFVFAFSDPRFSIIISNLIIAVVIFKLFKLKNRREESYPFIAAFLFLPRSFYILEHMYLDPVIFSFFLLFIYSYIKKRYSLSTLLLSLFFSFKQHLIFLLPLFVKHTSKKFHTFKHTLIFLLPFFLPLLFLLINPSAFLKNIVFFFNPQHIPAPVLNSLSLTTLFTRYMIKSPSIYLNVIFFILFLFFFLLIIFKRKTFLIPKLAVSLILFNFFMYHSFFNHYYLVALFLLFDILCNYLKIRV